MNPQPQPVILYSSVKEVMAKPDMVIPKILPWIRDRRWSGLKGTKDLRVRVLDSVVLEKFVDYTILVAFIRVSGLRDGGKVSEEFFLPLFLTTSLERCDKGIRVNCQNGQIGIVEAEYTQEYNRRTFEDFCKREEIKTLDNKIIKFESKGPLWKKFGELNVEVLGKADTTNIIVKIYDDSPPLVVKTYKVITEVNPEPEILKVLADAEFRHAPKLLGRIIYKKERPMIVGVLEAYEENIGDGRKPFLDNLVSDLLEVQRTSEGKRGDEEVLREFIDQKLNRSRIHDISAHLGGIIAEFHYVMANSTSRNFGARKVVSEDIERWQRRACLNLKDCLGGLSTALETWPLSPIAKKALTSLFNELLTRRGRVEERIGLFDKMLGMIKMRTHQDLHLAQLLSKRTDNDFDFMIIDFEGDPQRTGKARREKEPPFRDLGTMARSFGYVKYAVLAEVLNKFSYPDVVALVAYLNVKGEWAEPFFFGKPFEKNDLNYLIHYSNAWEKAVENAMIEGYLQRSRELGVSHILKEGRFDKELLRLIVELWKIDKAILEIRYELSHRPQNIAIPLEGLLSCVPYQLKRSMK